MKKRAKIIAIVSTLCLCLSLFVIGVLAVSTASLSVTSSLSFKSNGAYVMVDGQLRQGATGESATLQSGAPATYKYKGYSYNCIGGTGADKDKPNGTASLENFVDASGAPNAPWAIGEINFTNELPVAVYHFTFTNYSAMMVAVSVSSNIQDLNADLAGKVSITESFESGNTIDAYDGTTAKTIVYTITVEIENYTTSFKDKQLELTINFSTDLPDQSDYFKYNTAGTQIIGLSEKYFEDTPSVLIVPAYSKSGQKLSIATGSYSSPTFNGLVSSTVILQEGLTSVPNYAFYNCSSLSSIEIPSTVTSIGFSAFENCSSLSSITIPGGVTSIGSNTFSDCSSLSSVTFDGDSQLTSIDYNAFYDCSSLSSINIPDGVTSIGDYAFEGCSSLSTVTFGENSQLTSIGSQAFSKCSSLSSINIPEGVTSIDERTFEYCSSLSSINIPEGVTSIGEFAFSDCSSLSSIILPEGVTSISNWTFNGCSSLSSINIPDGVTSIGSDAFRNCYSLSSITIPERVISIDSSAFSSCYSLVEVYNYSPSITVNEGETSSSNNGYLGQYALYVYNAKDGTEPEPTKLSVEKNVQYYTDGTDIIAIGTFGNRNAINEITFKDDTTKINTYAFYQCYALTSVTLPSSVINIGSFAFTFCCALAEVYNYSSFLNITDNYSNGYVGYYAKVVHNLEVGAEKPATKILKEDGMQYYDNGNGKYIALSPIDRSSIKEVNIKAGTTEINQRAFYECYYALTSVTLPSSVTSIGSSAFYACNNLTMDLTKVDWGSLTLGRLSISPSTSAALIVIIVAENAPIDTVKTQLTTAVEYASSDTIQIKQGSTTYVWKGSSTGWVKQTA